MEQTKYTNVAGGVVVNNSTGYILVVNRLPNSWSLPKGHIDDNEDPLTAAKREIYEESGVTEVHLEKELGKYKRFKIGLHTADDESEVKDIRMYLFTTDQESLSPQDSLHPEALWVSRDEVVKLLTHEKDQEFFKSIMSELPQVPEQKDE